jgi:hypothetical protein
MSFEGIWRELEAEPQPAGGGRLRRRVHGQAAADLNLELVLPDRTRVLSLTVPEDLIRGEDELPQARGVAHNLAMNSTPGRAILSLELIDPAAADIFGVLAEDVATATANAQDNSEAVGIWTGRIARWQRLLRNAPYGLGPELQRALYAELWVMRELLGPEFGVADAVVAWEGPNRALHDYQLPAGSLEVKSCAANQPQVVTINGERQLDETGANSLHLVHVSLDVHQHGPESLAEMVASVRASAADTAAQAQLEERLLDYGYLDAHERRYRRTGFAVRETRFFRIGPEFPRLIESDLPEGVGTIRYRLAIAACAPFEVERAQLLEALGVTG